MKCKIVSPDRTREFPRVAAVTLPASGGEMQILPGHAETFVKLRSGAVVLKSKEKISLPVSESVCYVKNDEILIIQ